MIEQEGQGFVDSQVFNEVIIVEDEHSVVRGVVGDVDECGQNGFMIGRHGTEERVELTLSNLRLHCLPGGQQVAEKLFKIVIGFIEGEPGDGEVDGTRPLGQEGSFAVSSRSG
jgi:hypothetical protein